jgi:cytidine deaminase
MSFFDREALLAAARRAAAQAYAPYSQFRVGAALLFADGAVVTAAVSAHSDRP